MTSAPVLLELQRGSEPASGAQRARDGRPCEHALAPLPPAHRLVPTSLCAPPVSADAALWLLRTGAPASANARSARARRTPGAPSAELRCLCASGGLRGRRVSVYTLHGAGVQQDEEYLQAAPSRTDRGADSAGGTAGRGRGFGRGGRGRGRGRAQAPLGEPCQRLAWHRPVAASDRRASWGTWDDGTVVECDPGGFRVVYDHG